MPRHLAVLLLVGASLAGASCGSGSGASPLARSTVNQDSVPALAPCPASPNCVSTEAPAGDDRHYIAAPRFTDDPASAWARLRAALLAEKRITVVREVPGRYLEAEARSLIFRFVDDVQLILDADAGVVRMRSASRVGESDLGVNRRRLQRIAERFAADP